MVKFRFKACVSERHGLGFGSGLGSCLGSELRLGLMLDLGSRLVLKLG